MAGTITASIVKDPSSPTNNILLGATGNVTLGADTTATGAMSIGGLTTLSASGIRMVNGSNTTNILAPSTAVTSTLTLPATTGTFALTSQLPNSLTSGTSQNSTSGTSFDFTGIPSWVKRITLILSGVSTSGTSNVQVQLGSGSIQTTGYLSYGSLSGGANNSNSVSSTTGLLVNGGATDANVIRYGAATFYNISGNLWVLSLALGLWNGTTPYGGSGGGNVTLSGVLDRLRLTTVNGTDTFDAGSINIMYE